MTKNTLFAVTVLLFGAISSFAVHAQLKVGTTLHPYYSYVANVVGDKAEVLPLIDSGFNPHSYSLTPKDIARLKSMDVLVVNGIGHDQFALKAVDRINLPNLKVLYANKNVPLIGHGKKSNPHTFVAIDAAIAQVYTIARELAKVDKDNGKYFLRNAMAYARKLKALKRSVQKQILELDLSQVKIASTHNAYGYFLQEFGLTVSAVVEPAHGISPTASQLQQTIDEIKATDVDVLFTELNMENHYVEVIERETGIGLFHFSHMTHGEYDVNMVGKGNGSQFEKVG